MHRSILFIALAIMAALVVQPSAAGALDTSPYLTGTWGSAVLNSVPFGVNYFIGNPTVKPLDVYAVFYSRTGVLSDCVYTTLQPNGNWYLFDDGFRGYYAGGPGTVKFFAFPAGTRKFDPNAVIGGFQQELLPNGAGQIGEWCQVVEANLKAVTVNSWTIGEFSRVPVPPACTFWQPPPPPGFPPGIFCNFAPWFLNQPG